jgi:hypothetical protein
MMNHTVTRFLPAFVVALVVASPARADVLPYCSTEDGSDYPNRSCVWVDPDTGREYVNTYAE